MICKLNFSIYFYLVHSLLYVVLKFNKLLLYVIMGVLKETKNIVAVSSTCIFVYLQTESSTQQGS